MKPDLTGLREFTRERLNERIANLEPHVLQAPGLLSERQRLDRDLQKMFDLDGTEWAQRKFATIFYSHHPDFREEWRA